MQHKPCHTSGEGRDFRRPARPTAVVVLPCVNQACVSRGRRSHWHNAGCCEMSSGMDEASGKVDIWQRA